MLLQRVVTALVLVGLLLAALSMQSLLPFAVLTLVLISAAAWEWGLLNQSSQALALTMGAAVAFAGVTSLTSGWATAAPPALWWAAVALWLFGGALALRTGPGAWPALPRALRWFVGVFALWLTWLAVAQLRALGINFLLSALCVVWMADVAAYFGGRSFGKRKLAPSISPGKSWEGVWSGMLGVLLLAAFWLWLDTRFAFDSSSLFTRLFASLGGAGLVLALLALCAFSVLGDLVESLVKRAAGAKDSSRLLPGHGGVLDRIDALLPVLPAALALTWLTTLSKSA
jgi:phosphatidate cytidylyltransferase